ncbi:MAG: energy transducer TonB [Prevotella sp.]|nr:energy transducer TonB [Prevotella sp.]
MNKGKSICNVLRGIRKQIAEKNGISYEPKVCTHEGQCRGTCPACEAEMRYICQSLKHLQTAGHRIQIAGVSLGMMTLAACGNAQIQTESTAKDSLKTAHINEDMCHKDSTRRDTLAKKAAPPVAKDSLIVLPENMVFGEIAEEMPAFPGGNTALMEFLYANTTYPEECLKEGIEGRVIGSFVVEKDGSTTGHHIVRSVHPQLDAEALRVLRMMPKWVPGCINGQPTCIKYNVPITFKLPEVRDEVFSTTGEIVSTDIEQPIVTQEVYDVVEEMPQFPGGSKALMEYLNQNLRYPETEECAQGRIIVGFIVNEDGTLSNFELKRSLTPALDKEALRVVKSMPNWIPGRQNDKVVKVRYYVPILFRLE